MAKLKDDRWFERRILMSGDVAWDCFSPSSTGKRCPARGFSLEEMQSHIELVHIAWSIWRS